MDYDAFMFEGPRALGGGPQRTQYSETGNVSNSRKNLNLSVLVALAEYIIHKLPYGCVTLLYSHTQTTI